jgi:transposase
VRLVERHAAYRWLCGGVAVAYHRLDGFRSDHGDVFSELVSQLLARLMKHDLIDLHRVVQDVTRIRAFARAASF